MKTKLKFIGIIIVIFFIICLALKFNKKANNVEPVVSTATDFQEKNPIEWHGNYIWDDTNDDNTWMCFRKQINIEEDNINNAIAQIAVDSKYWLYINDEMVIREGALKRGEKPNSIYYDEIDLSKYLRKGENTIAILAWYWGGESYSHISSGQAGMLFQLKVGDKYFVSDDTWKVKKNLAYQQDSLRPNNRLIEYNVKYDASDAEDDWYKSEYDDSKWKNSIILNIAGALPWGELIERNIPQFKNYEIKEYENIKKYENYKTTKKETLELDLPYNMQFTPYLKIEAPEGLQISIKTDTYEDINGDSVKCTYITKKGEQEFESLAWMNGEKVYYSMPKGVKVISLGYRQTSYDSEITGYFECNDKFFNDLWTKASRTLCVNMRDSYMDCPNRERAQWFGDMNSEMMESMYSLDTNSYALYEKGIKTIIGWIEQDALLTVVPNSLEAMHLPMQSLVGISGFYDYYEYTGKKEFLEEVYPYAKNYLNLWKEKDDGLYDCTSLYYIWEWGDSASNVDYDALENAFYYMAMSKTCKMAEVLGYEEDKSNFESKLQKLKTSFNEKIWTDNGYKTKDCKNYDERTNAVAVISGIADKDKYPVIKNILVKEKESSAYMERYVLEALCQMGYINEAQERIKNRYDDMVNGKKACSTLWENWDPDAGTKNHAWSGGPLIIMSKYFAGIRPLESGYEKIEIKPKFGNLNKISSKVTTVKGDISLDANKTDDQIILKINVPSKTLVAINKKSDDTIITVNNKEIYKNGKAKKKKNKAVKYESEDEEYVYFYVRSGEYEFVSK